MSVGNRIRNSFYPMYAIRLRVDTLDGIRNALGLVQVYTGDGKGKTTAALGLAMRASGRGLNVIMIQFMKPDAGYGEQIAAKQLSDFTILPMGPKHFCGPEPTAEDVESVAKALDKSREVLTSGKYDLVILDEINNALRYGLTNPDEVVNILKERAPHTEVVLTGRRVPQEIIDYADLVTEMRLIKHPFDKGIGARVGIEY